MPKNFRTVQFKWCKPLQITNEVNINWKVLLLPGEKCIWRFQFALKRRENCDYKWAGKCGKWHLHLEIGTHEIPRKNKAWKSSFDTLKWPMWPTWLGEGKVTQTLWIPFSFFKTNLVKVNYPVRGQVSQTYSTLLQGRRAHFTGKFKTSSPSW